MSKIVTHHSANQSVVHGAVADSLAAIAGRHIPQTNSEPVWAGSDVGPTACIVTCHNHGRFLRQCLDSLLSQSMPFEHIVLVDDGSTDETAAIGAEYSARGVIYHRVEVRDAALARNAGVEVVARPRFFLFVDADNWIEPNYHAALREAMRAPNVAVAYAPLQRVDERGHDLGTSSDIREYSYTNLSYFNFADSCALIRQEAFEIAGRWKPVAYHLHDWNLWLRITRLGWAMQLVSNTHLNYRVHLQSLSAARVGRAEVCLDAYRDGMTTAIVTLFSGKMWQLGRYEKSLQALNWNRENLHLIALDNSNDPAFSRALKAMLNDLPFASTHVRETRELDRVLSAAQFADNPIARTSRQREMNLHMARLYSVARAHLPHHADLVWCLEDDIEAPANALEKLAVALYNDHAAAAAAAVARDRFVGGTRLLVWRHPHQPSWREDPAIFESGFLENAPPGVSRIDVSGFYCTLFRRDFFHSLTFRPSPEWDDWMCYYDWAAAWDAARLGRRWLLVGDAICRHRKEDGSFV